MKIIKKVLLLLMGVLIINIFAGLKANAQKNSQAYTDSLKALDYVKYQLRRDSCQLVISQNDLVNLEFELISLEAKSNFFLKSIEKLVDLEDSVLFLGMKIMEHRRDVKITLRSKYKRIEDLSNEIAFLRMRKGQLNLYFLASR
ncbi:MAG: hypothetical protein NTX85_03525 [Candidatus Nomurabacteria bacterium]|nr:hypothetical protein [Candidatus Nomurabacteria bacterium]